MRECNNCRKVIRNGDKYCRNCGIRILKPYQSVLINIVKIVLIVTLVIMIAMFIVSYFI